MTTTRRREKQMTDDFFGRFKERKDGTMEITFDCAICARPYKSIVNGTRRVWGERTNVRSCIFQRLGEGIRW